MDQLSQHLSESRMSGIPVRVSVELGRSSCALSEAVALTPGQVVGLDQELQEPVSVYVDGLLYGSGQLTTVDGHWAVKFEQVMVVSKEDYIPQPSVEPQEDQLEPEIVPAEESQ